MQSSRQSSILGVLTLAAIAAAITYFALDDTDQREVTVQRGNPVPEARSVDREDDHGADVVRAHLQAAVNCEGEPRALCDAEDARAELVGDGPVWRVEAGGERLELRVRRDDGAWSVVSR